MKDKDFIWALNEIAKFIRPEEELEAFREIDRHDPEKLDKFLKEFKQRVDIGEV